MLLIGKISDKEFQKLYEKYPIFENIGQEHLGVKIWILYNALQNKSTSRDAIASNPCASLMKNNINLPTIDLILSDLVESEVLQFKQVNNEFSVHDKTPDLDVYVLSPEIKFELQKIVYDTTQRMGVLKIDPEYTSVDLEIMLNDCGYSSTYTSDEILRNLHSDDGNKLKISQLKDLLTKNPK